MTNESKYLIYSTFHPTGHLSRHVVDQLNAYKQLGFELIVVDTSPEYTAARQAFYTAIGAHAIHRENTGYDFTSYKVGFQKLQALHQDKTEASSELGASAPWVLIANDSCFGPLFPLDTVFSKIPTTPTEPTCYGLTESWDRETFHLQSYWLYFTPTAYDTLARYFNAMPAITDRESAIVYGELGLGQFLPAHGVQQTVLFSQEKCFEAIAQQLRFPMLARYKIWLFEGHLKPSHVVRRAMGRYLRQRERFVRLNPSIYCIPVLVEALGCPLVKIQRFRDGIFKPSPDWRHWTKDAVKRYPILGEQCADYDKTYKALANIRY